MGSASTERAPLSAMLRSMNDILNLSQDIEDIIRDDDLLGSVQMASILSKAQLIQQKAVEILPG